MLSDPGGIYWIEALQQGVSMHLLVLSAFRLRVRCVCIAIDEKSQCTFWCSVLSDTVPEGFDLGDEYVSQCTFWCSVLSDVLHFVHFILFFLSQCTFWCSVLSDRADGDGDRGGDRRPVSMHLLVLSAFRHELIAYVRSNVHQSQCTFWCSVLSDTMGAWLMGF